MQMSYAGGQRACQFFLKRRLKGCTSGRQVVVVYLRMFRSEGERYASLESSPKQVSGFGVPDSRFQVLYGMRPDSSSRYQRLSAYCLLAGKAVTAVYGDLSSCEEERQSPPVTSQ